jgi:hypothetical protein
MKEIPRSVTESMKNLLDKHGNLRGDPKVAGPIVLLRKKIEKLEDKKKVLLNSVPVNILKNSNAMTKEELDSIHLKIQEIQKEVLSDYKDRVNSQKEMNEILATCVSYEKQNDKLELLNFNNETEMRENIKFIPKKFNIIEHHDSGINFINSQIDQTILEKYTDSIFYCGYNELKSEYKNIINVGTPYQLNKKSSSGFYVVDSTSNKNKYISNKTSTKFKTIRITDISQIKDLDAEYIKKNL